MTTKRRREPDAGRLTMDAPAPRHTPEELDAEIAATEAHLQELYREKAYVPYPKMLFRAPLEGTPQSEPEPAPEPVAVESVTVYSDAGVAAAEAEGYTEDYESVVDPPPPDPPVTRASEPSRSGD